MTAIDADARGRQAFRAFVRSHHPDLGGDPSAFAAGLAVFGRGAGTKRQMDAARDARFDAPVVFYRQPHGIRALLVWLRSLRAQRQRVRVL